MIENDTMVKAIDMTIKQISGEEIDKSKFPKLNSRDELLNIYQAFKKAILLLENIKPTEKEIKEGLSGNICRCTGYTKIFKAVKEVSLSLEEN